MLLLTSELPFFMARLDYELLFNWFIFVCNLQKEEKWQNRRSDSRCLQAELTHFVRTKYIFQDRVELWGGGKEEEERGERGGDEQERRRSKREGNC